MVNPVRAAARAITLRVNTLIMSTLIVAALQSPSGI
jgi:hypothetical protein